MVAPSGSTKEDTSFLAPSFSTHSILIGNVPTEDALENANMIAGSISLKKVAGLTPPIVFTAMEYTTTA